MKRTHTNLATSALAVIAGIAVLTSCMGLTQGQTVNAPTPAADAEVVEISTQVSAPKDVTQVGLEAVKEDPSVAPPASLSTLSNPPALHPYSGTSALAEAIATQIELATASTFNCDFETVVLSEACHLFKTSLYITYGTPTPDDVRNAHTDPAFQQNYAIAVVNAVPIIVSRSVYELSVIAIHDYVAAGVNAEETLGSGAGQCGNKTYVALALFEAAHIEARTIQFWYTLDGDATDRSNHSFVEVLVSDEFKPLDTTYGAYWVREDGSMATTSEMTIDNVIWNQALHYASPSFLGDIRFPMVPFEYLFAKSRANVTQGGHGEITYYLEETQILHIPAFIGDNEADGYTGGTSFNVEGQGTTTVTVSAYAGADAQICLDGNCEPITAAGGTFSFDNAGNGNLHIDGFEDVAYAVITSIETK